MNKRTDVTKSLPPQVLLAPLPAVPVILTVTGRPSPTFAALSSIVPSCRFTSPDLQPYHRGFSLDDEDEWLAENHSSQINQVVSPINNLPHAEVRPMSATLKLNKNDRMLDTPYQFCDNDNPSHLNTGAIQSAMSESELQFMFPADPLALLEERTALDNKSRIANGNIVPIR